MATMTAGFLLAVVGGSILLASGRRLSEIRAFHFEPPFLAAVLVCMVGATFVGGYVAGRVAGAAHLRHGIVMGFLSLLVGKLLTTGTYPAWFDLLATGLALPAAIAGAMIAKRHTSTAFTRAAPGESGKNPPA
ncbi:MAG TPA: hypothetical protein VGK08_07520 [Thermoanaerobaculia bacterium]|jgi:hypothetical protein